MGRGVKHKIFVKNNVKLPVTGFPRALENLENHKKSSMHGKVMEFEKS